MVELPSPIANARKPIATRASAAEPVTRKLTQPANLVNARPACPKTTGKTPGPAGRAAGAGRH
jgi:hypothetical protein